MEGSEMEELICGLEPGENVFLIFRGGDSVDALLKVEELYSKYFLRYVGHTFYKIDAVLRVHEFFDMNEGERTIEVGTGFHFDGNVAKEWCKLLIPHLEKITKKTPK